MSINFDKALGIHAQALALREKRSEVLASNLVNADTPGYKARDLDFSSVLKQNMPSGLNLSGLNLERTRTNHLAPPELTLGARMMYRNPNQASLDGNTVEAHVEQAKFAENAVQYQASLNFINNSLAGLMTALRGE
ncbi:flagellar basal body rod protein FlgB [Methylomicrobium album]|uniref:Flagellar basal body rod protein FlgB n=1 Tax=Methylomicrobium album BG8 TaxID=686340 RepID=H8GNF4_METAL|nr:flagellar basal body rod protein FlgB [Methylomicrobium album]EIC29547.1 flagellar basal-body rod protein FlgB [Methylomicrobium album BG8]